MKLVEETAAAEIRETKSEKRLKWLSPAVCLALVVVTWAVFGRAVTFGFFNYDDSFYVYQNSSINHGLTKAGLIRAFTHPLVGNWHPLTSISLMLDAQWSGLHAGGYHLVNVILHSLAVLLLFFFLRTMTGADLVQCFCRDHLCYPSSSGGVGRLDFGTQGRPERCLFFPRVDGVCSLRQKASRAWELSLNSSLSHFRASFKSHVSDFSVSPFALGLLASREIPTSLLRQSALAYSGEASTSSTGCSHRGCDHGCASTGSTGRT